MTEALATRLRDGERLVGLITKMSAPSVVELGGHLGFDLVIVDTEHGLFGGIELEHHLRAGDAARIPVLVRVSELGRPQIQWALDGGAAGVVVPQVESAEHAAEAVALAHYPAFGSRGLAISTRAGLQGTVGSAEHLRRSRDETVVVVQIESAAGVRDAAEIAATEGVSAVWIGLSDLAMDLGHPGDAGAPEIVEAVDRVVEAVNSAAIPLFVIADDAAAGQVWRARGATALLVNFLNVAARGLGELRTAHYRGDERVSG